MNTEPVEPVNSTDWFQYDKKISLKLINIVFPFYVVKIIESHEQLSAGFL